MSRSWAIFKYSISASSLVQRQKERKRLRGIQRKEKRKTEGGRRGGAEVERNRRSDLVSSAFVCGICRVCVIYKNSATQLLRGWKHNHSADTKHNYNSLTGLRGHAWWQTRLIPIPPREKTNAQNSSPFLSTVLLASQGQLSKKKKKKNISILWWLSKN